MSRAIHKQTGTQSGGRNEIKNGKATLPESDG